MAPRHVHSKSKSKVVRFLPSYKAPSIARRSLMSNKSRLTRPSIPGGHTGILKQDVRSTATTNSRDNNNNSNSTQFINNLNHCDVELAQLIDEFRTYTGISDSQMKRAIRLIKTMQKLLHTLFATGKRKAHNFNEIEKMKRRLELLAELKHLADSKRATNVGKSFATKSKVAETNRIIRPSTLLSTLLRSI